MKPEDDQMPEYALEHPFEQAVTQATPAEDGTWHVILSCGHMAVWVTQPYFMTPDGPTSHKQGATAPCSQCLHEFLDAEKQHPDL